MKILGMVKDMKLKHSFSSPQKIWEDFSLFVKLFVGEQTFLGKFMGGSFFMGSDDQIMQDGRKSFTNAFSSNLNSVNPKIFPGHDVKHT